MYFIMLESKAEIDGDPVLKKPTCKGSPYDAGFKDIAYFNRVFRKRLGATPGNFATVEPAAQGRKYRRGVWRA
jgi:hypothetical protein